MKLFDSNAVANDENGQFLAGAFVHSAVLPFPANGPGVRLEAKLAEPLSFGLGYGRGDADSSDNSDSADILRSRLRHRTRLPVARLTLKPKEFFC